ncbi:hypothetical protein [Roseospira goensis]|uniref:Uncharacterized protein n=1 Tax=Roseospira goensis TaxID=391922 RepID=A0A7W6WJZ4_9PROT|nr:hypothetical protein [Roseospira goensis]MBB4285585.1 hypothetical protein [Roseospira goensis]
MTRASDARGAPSPRPGLGLAVLAIAAALLLAAPAGLVTWRLTGMQTDAAALETAREDARALAAVARAIEGLRGLARQIRYAPAGAAGAEARDTAADRLGVLAADPAWRVLAPEAVGTALDEARSAVERLATRRSEREPWPVVISDRLAALERFAAGPDDDSATPRARRLGALLDVLRTASRAQGAALPFLERRARQLAAEAIALPGLPLGLDPATRLGSGASVHAAIADALEVPAGRRAALTERAGLDVLWRTADRALAEAADGALAAADARLAATHAGLAADRARLTAALVAALLGVVSIGLATVLLAAHGHAGPLGRLGRRAAALGFARRRASWDESVAVAALDRALSASEADRARAADAEQGAADARRDAGTLASALLGAAAEAAAGRTVPGLAAALDAALARARRSAELAHQEAAVLAPADGTTRAAGGDARATRAAHRIGAACADVTDGLAEAEALLAALHSLGGTSAPPPIALAPLLEEVLTGLDPRLHDAHLHLSLSCPAALRCDADPATVAAIVAYTVEAVALRAEAAPAETADRPAVALAVYAAQAAENTLTLSLADDGPAPTPEARTLLAEARPATDPAGLARALRTAPDAAALLLADGLARAGLGRALHIAVDEADTGVAVTVTLPAAAPEGAAVTPE